MLPGCRQEVDMRALAVFPRERELRITEVPAPRPSRGSDVLVRVREVGICGTDRDIMEGHYGTPPPGTERLVLGHEGLGEVVDVGSSVRTLARGDLVAMTVRRPCPDAACVACRAGRQDFCITGHFRERGIKEADGFLAELVVEDERYLVRMPRSLADVGVLVEPLTIAAKAEMELEAITRRYPWEPTGLRSLVLGAGPIGLLGAMMMVTRDIETFVFSLAPADSDVARLVRSFGGEYVSARDTDVSELSSRIGMVDILYEGVGVAKVAFAALAALAPNGVFIFTGLPGAGEPVEIDLDRVMRDIVLKNQVLFGTVNASRSAFEAAVRDLERFMALFPDAVRGLVTERAKLEDAPGMLKRRRGIKQVVTLA
jgi:threonine dehydrogenase-like Zn-dependent dehydrogenase